jgi:outer membrane protein
MTRKFARVLLASVAVMAWGPVSAETLTDTLIKAYQTSPLLDANRASLRALDENVPQARSALRPQVSATAGATAASAVDDFPMSDVYAAELQASLLLFDNGQSKAALESARYGVASGRASLLNVEQEVLFAAVTAYMDVIQAQEFVRIARNDVTVLGEQLDATNNRFEVGEVTRTDVSQTEARLAQSRANLVDSEGALQIARQDYLAAVGVLPGPLEPAPPHPQLPATVKEAEAIGVRQNPPIVAARFAERGAVSDFDRARAASGLTIQATGAVDYAGRHSLGPNSIQTVTGDTIRGSGSAGDRVNVTLGVGASVPLYTGGRNSSLIRQAQQVLEQRKFQVQDTGRQVIQQVSNAWTQLDVARASIVANKEQVVAAQIAFEGVTEEARLGARSTLDVLDSDQERLRAEAEVVRAQRDEYVAAYAVLRSMGLLTVEHLNLGIDSYNPDVYFTEVQRAPMGGYDTSVVDRIRARWEK